MSDEFKVPEGLEVACGVLIAQRIYFYGCKCGCGGVQIMLQTAGGRTFACAPLMPDEVSVAADRLKEAGSAAVPAMSSEDQALAHLAAAGSA